MRSPSMAGESSMIASPKLDRKKYARNMILKKASQDLRKASTHRIVNGLFLVFCRRRTEVSENHAGILTVWDRTFPGGNRKELGCLARSGRSAWSQGRSRQPEAPARHTARLGFRARWDCEVEGLGSLFSCTETYDVRLCFLN